MNKYRESKKNPKRFRQIVLILGILALLMLLLHLLNVVFGYKLLFWFGLRPRHLDGLQGIVFSPWLHCSWGHLASNLPPLLILSLLCMWQGIMRYIIGSALIMFISGLLVWLFGRAESLHVGASGWIFGLWAWLLVSGVLHRRIKSLVAGVVVFVLYSGMIWGILPQSGISFEYHIAGIVAGVVVAFLSKPFQAPR